MEMSKYLQSFIANNQKDLFLLAYDSQVDIIQFIYRYMKSDICSKIDSDFSYWQTQSTVTILEAVLQEIKVDERITKNVMFNRDAIEWLGYFYRKWHFMTGETSTLIS